MVCSVRQVTATDPLFAEVSALFDGYRQHYGANPAPAATTAWLAAHTGTDRLRVFAAVDGGTVLGMLTVSVVPASLTLRTFWFIRDLYVAPRARRRGVARGLLAHVTHAARAQGAHRLALQTEVDNVAAGSLYADLGFQPVTDLAQLILPL
jgi:GNAT superfamily N-acetyltransferase